jgi:hypothetical protein
MTVETAFAKELTRSQDSNDGFLALLRNDGELDLAILDVKNSVPAVSLRKNNFILLVFGYCFSLAHFGKKRLGIKRGLASLPQHDPPFLDHTPALFARIEQLVDQVFLNSAVPKNQPLEQPSCIITPSDIEPLRGLIALSLSLSRVTSLEPLWGLPVLRSLDLSGAEVANFEHLRELTALEQLNLSGTRLENLDPLKGLTTLNSLDLSGIWIANLDQLKALTPLRSFDLSLTRVAGLESLK